MNDFITYSLLPFSAYLVGSIPFGLILSKIFAGVDVRRMGSGNIGATNVRRLAGNKLGFITLITDMAKGALPVGLALMLFPSGNHWQQIFPLAAFLAVFMGHLYPVFSGFTGGGKGVATAGGALFPLSMATFCMAVLTFLGVVLLTRRVSAGSLATAALLPLMIWINTHSVISTLVMVLIAAMIWWRHRENIKRLQSGSEPSLW